MNFVYNRMVQTRKGVLYCFFEAVIVPLFFVYIEKENALFSPLIQN